MRLPNTATAVDRGLLLADLVADTPDDPIAWETSDIQLGGNNPILQVVKFAFSTAAQSDETAAAFCYDAQREVNDLRQLDLVYKLGAHFVMAFSDVWHHTSDNDPIALARLASLGSRVAPSQNYPIMYRRLQRRFPYTDRFMCQFDASLHALQPQLPKRP